LPQHTAKHQTSEIFGIGIAMGKHGYKSMAIPDTAFLAVWICSYTIRHVEYDQLFSDSYASCYFFSGLC